MPETGGDCKLEAENSLLEKPDEAVSAYMHDSGSGSGLAGSGTLSAGGGLTLGEFDAGQNGSVSHRTLVM